MATGGGIVGSMAGAGKMLFIVGLVIAGAGLLLWSGVGRGWLGRLPGDIRVVRPNYSFHFPIVTCLLLSLLVSAALWLLRK
ncbi:MAG TPA: DUF2905 domain-containing protein [Opitutus sp.]|nr:DUF2905 domain-containing protein [Opitutus sp.]